VQSLIHYLLISALFKRSLAQSLFKKEQMSNRSFQKSDEKSDHSFALSKRAKEQK